MPSELLDHACIRLRFSSGALAEWELERDGEFITIDPPARIIVNANAANTGIDFARQGHGIVSAFENWLTPWFEAGELVPVMTDWWTEFEGPWLYYSSRFTPAPLRAFVAVLHDFQHLDYPRHVASPILNPSSTSFET